MPAVAASESGVSLRLGLVTMARPMTKSPTSGELEILQVLWDHGPSTVRGVLSVLEQHRPRAYTSIMSLLNIMVDKKLVARELDGRAYVYRALRPREKTLGQMIGGVLGRAFAGSAHELVAHVLEQSRPSSDELDEIRRVIEAYEREETK